MGRCWLGIGLLVGLLVLGLAASVVADNAYAQLSDTLDLAARQLLAGNWAEGLALTQKAQQGWESSRRAMAVLADHAPLETIDSRFAALQVYAQAGQTVPLAAGCAQLSQLVRNVGSTQGLSWWDFL